MKGIKYDLKKHKMILKKLKLARKFSMIKYRVDWPVPELKYDNQIQVRTRLGGICTSDIHQIDVNLPYSATILARRDPPFPNGHEVIGEVTQVGSDVEDLKIGDRVAHSPVASCDAFGFDPCPSCVKGLPESCYTLVGRGDGSELEEKYGGRGTFGGFSGGGFSEYFVGFAKQFTKVPDGLSDELAVLAEPLAVSIHAVAPNLPHNDDTVIIIGAGIIGLMAIAAIRSFGSRCRVITVARYPFQAAAATKLGADDVILTEDKDKLYEAVAEKSGGVLFKPIRGNRILYGNSGPDVIFDTVGTDSTIDDSLRLVRSNGKIVLVGMSFGKTKKTEWALQIYKEIEVKGSMMHGIETFEGEREESMELALRFLQDSPELYEGLVTHRFVIDEYKTAFACSSNKGKTGAIKVVFDFA